MPARARGAHPLNGVPALLIVDDRAAVVAGAPAAPATVGTALEPTDLPIAAVPMHGVHLREGAGTLAAPTERLLAGRRAILRLVSPHRSPSR